MMKKFIAFTTAAVLLAVMPVSTLAEEEKQIVLAVSEETVTAGDTVTVTLSLENFGECNTFMFYEPEYDAEYLEWTGGEWLLDGIVLSDYITESQMNGETEQGRSGVCYTENTVSGNVDLVTMEFTVLKESSTALTVDCSVVVKNAATTLSDNVEVVPTTLNVGTETVPGDTNGDGEVSPKDRLYLERYIAGWDGYTLETINFDAADINGDGEITPKDRLILARHLANWEGYEDLSAFRT